MTTSEQTETATETPTSMTSSVAHEESSSKKKKAKLKFAAQMQRAEAVAYFRALVDGLDKGQIEFKQGADTLELSPASSVALEVKASAKGDKQRISFELEWSGEADDFDIGSP